MSDPGRIFERQLIAGLPPWRHLHGRIVPDHPAAFIADRQGAEGARFVRPNPWDIEIRWLTRGRREWNLTDCADVEAWVAKGEKP